MYGFIASIPFCNIDTPKNILRILKILTPNAFSLTFTSVQIRHVLVHLIKVHYLHKFVVYVFSNMKFHRKILPVCTKIT